METSFTGKTASGPKQSVDGAQIRWDANRFAVIVSGVIVIAGPFSLWLGYWGAWLWLWYDNSLSLSRSLSQSLSRSPVGMINNKSNAKMSVMYVACQRLRLFMAWINKNNAPISDYKLTQRQKTTSKMSTAENVSQLLLLLLSPFIYFISDASQHAASQAENFENALENVVDCAHNDLTMVNRSWMPMETVAGNLNNISVYWWKIRAIKGNMVNVSTQ